MMSRPGVSSDHFPSDPIIGLSRDNNNLGRAPGGHLEGPGHFHRHLGGRESNEAADCVARKLCGRR